MLHPGRSHQQHDADTHPGDGDGRRGTPDNRQPRTLLPGQRSAQAKVNETKDLLDSPAPGSARAACASGVHPTRRLDGDLARPKDSTLNISVADVDSGIATVSTTIHLPTRAR